MVGPLGEIDLSKDKANWFCIYIVPVFPRDRSWRTATTGKGKVTQALHARHTQLSFFQIW